MAAPLTLLIHLLSHDLTRVKFNEHSPIRLQLLYRDRKSKIVQQKELQFQVI